MREPVISSSPQSTKTPLNQEWTIGGFLAEFRSIHEVMHDRKFCFILGSGASKSSGIPTGAELVDRWLRDLQIRFDPEHKRREIAAWATAQNLNIENFIYTHRAEFYAQVYERRFRDDPDRGYADLEVTMKNSSPSIGYSVLAQILDRTRHKIVITTNFDNLVADALSIYTKTFPLVCGHETLAGFARTELRRPLIAKIHRDLLLAPQSDSSGTSHLPTPWAESLQKLLTRYTPIVIGYGGNDGSLMEFLETTLSPGHIPGGIFWCYTQSQGIPVNDRIARVVLRHNGCFVPILGFDELMIQLRGELNRGDQKFENLDNSIDTTAKEKIIVYREQLERITKKLTDSEADLLREEIEPDPLQEEIEPDLLREEAREIGRESIRQSIPAIAHRGWWDWELAASAEKDPLKKEAIYRAAIADVTDNPDLYLRFAAFLKGRRQNYAEADSFFKKAVDLAPTNAHYALAYANFLKHSPEKRPLAKSYFKKALDLDPNNTSALIQLARFYQEDPNTYNLAENCYRDALDLDPFNPTIIIALAVFLKDVRESYDEAEQLYRNAIDADPTSAPHLVSFANFLCHNRQNFSEAEALYKNAVQIAPRTVPVLLSYAKFLADYRHNLNEAENILRKAVTADPKNLSLLLNLAFFLIEKRNDPIKAANTLSPFATLERSTLSIIPALVACYLFAYKFGEAENVLKKSWNNREKANVRICAEIAFYRALQLRSEGGNATIALGALKKLLTQTIGGPDKFVLPTVRHVRSCLKGDDPVFFLKIAEAMFDESKLEELNNAPLWDKIKPCEPDSI